MQAVKIVFRDNSGKRNYMRFAGDKYPEINRGSDAGAIAYALIEFERLMEYFDIAHLLVSAEIERY